MVQNPPVPGVDAVVAPRRAPATTLSSARASRAAALTVARARSGLLALVPEPLAATEAFIGFEVPVAEVGRVEPATIVTAARQLLVELPIRKAVRLLEGLRESELENLDPIMRPPRVLSPLAAHVGEESLELLVLDVATLGENRCACFVENRAVIAAMVVGANAEMARELRWRESRRTCAAPYWVGSGPGRWRGRKRRTTMSCRCTPGPERSTRISAGDRGPRSRW